jgi:hypothetical protein
MRLSKRDACKVLRISLSTLDARIKAGKLQVERTIEACGPAGFLGNNRCWVILRDEPEPVKQVLHSVTPVVASACPEHARSCVAQERPAPVDPDAEFARKYLAGEVGDSLGNTVDTVSRRSLLGPHPTDMPVPKSDCTSHMDPALLGQPGNERIENPIDSDAFAERLWPGHGERKKQMYQSAGVRPLSQQEQKQRNDMIALHAAFRWSR